MRFCELASECRHVTALFETVSTNLLFSELVEVGSLVLHLPHLIQDDFTFIARHMVGNLPVLQSGRELALEKLPDVVNDDGCSPLILDSWTTRFGVNYRNLPLNPLNTEAPIHPIEGILRILCWPVDGCEDFPPVSHDTPEFRSYQPVQDVIVNVLENLGEVVTERVCEELRANGWETEEKVEARFGF